jgi:hypothetical protein
MQYAILFYETGSDFDQRQDPARQQAYWGAWSSYVKAIQESGIVVSGAGLMPPGAATTLRMKGDQRRVQDGPYADTKEQLGGLFVIEVPDLDAALAWAARSPSAAGGAVEVRPCLPPMPV